MKRTLMMGTVGLLLGALVAFLLMHVLRLGGDLSRSAEPAGVANLQRMPTSSAFDDADGVMGGAAPAPAMAPPPEPMMEMEEKAAESFGGAPGGVNPVVDSRRADQSKDRGGRGNGEGGPEADSAPSRAWFPETFLFEPLVVTDASGAATVPVRVPDRLTGWRVLALAHSRSGAQAGAVARFSGTLPTYVDPVLPPFLRAGDAARLPVQVVNTTDSAVEVPLKVEAQGATVEGGSRTVRVPARGSVVEYVLVKAAGPGQVAVRATLGAADAVVRDFQVWPTGRPVVKQRGGTLAAPRTVTLEGPADAQAGSERVRLLVYPGALGVLRSEWATAGGRGGTADVAYTLMLVGRSPELLTALGETQAAEALKALTSGTRRMAAPPQPVEGALDVEGLRKLLAQATQRALREGRSPDVSTAALLAEGALLHPDNLVLARLGERLAAQVARAQSPDGTCQGGEGWTLQRLLVATADCMRVVNAAAGTPEGRRRAAFFAARALGAVERNRAHVKDGYTAAALLASGAVSGSLKEELRTQVREAVKTRDGGSAYLPVDSGVVDGGGVTPSETEATALAVLALDGDAKAPLADLGAFLLSRYEPALGWGGGRANRMALRAVVALFREPLPARVRVVLERDGQALTEGTYDAKALREVLALEVAAPGSGGAHTWTVRAEPAVPGLGYSLVLAAAVPWKPESQGGLELVVKGPAEARVGQPAEVVVEASTPSGLALELRHGLPAGVQVDPASLDALVSEGRVSSWDAEDGAVTLMLPPRGAGEPFQARFRVIPTLAGTLQAGASSLKVVARPDLVSYVPPTIWAVR
ncbi:alpha-2-macroglobulin family protein [Pyxidicoccus trucidator]|uniref:alpha-2-macroglobulin family protein n=1 Tax=Pyxidicoccus trucidator TaxID=2709662 RepID=UPI0019685F3B|nr:alpha-2-macroglobulin family protein [Pyxidicoccus trucidator]